LPTAHGGFENGGLISSRLDQTREQKPKGFKISTAVPSRKGLPIAQLTEQELLARYQGALKACFLRGRSIRIPSDIRALFDEVRVEIERRNLGPVTLPTCLSPDDPDPIIHEKAILRYLREPHLSSFLAGTISFAPAADYRNETDAARRDDEHARPFSIFPNQNIDIGGTQYATSEIRMRRVLRHDAEAENSYFSYHIASFSEEQSHKLARDFRADGAVLITDYQLFFDLLQAELRSKQPSAVLDLKGVNYYDPFAVDPSTAGSTDILWQKPIQFIYHREIRIVILNAVPGYARINLSIAVSNGLFELIKFEFPPAGGHGMSAA
jgi:hypothetical protein